MIKMVYKVEVKRSVVKAIACLETSIQRQIAEALKSLASCPFPNGSRKIQGRADTWRIRIGNYRVVYEVHEERLVIYVVRVGHRREVYRNL